MCHGYEGRDWSYATDEESEEETDTPSFLSDEAADDVEILTDGGDEDE